MKMFVKITGCTSHGRDRNTHTRIQEKLQVSNCENTEIDLKKYISTQWIDKEY